MVAGSGWSKGGQGVGKAGGMAWMDGGKQEEREVGSECRERREASEERREKAMRGRLG